MIYKSIEFTASITRNDNSGTVAKRLQSIIDSQSGQGWEYVRIETIETNIASENGCFGVGATPAFSTYFPVIIFQKSGTATYENQNITTNANESETITEIPTVISTAVESFSTFDFPGKLEELGRESSAQETNGFNVGAWFSKNKKLVLGVFISVLYLTPPIFQHERIVES